MYYFIIVLLLCSWGGLDAITRCIASLCPTCRPIWLRSRESLSDPAVLEWLLDCDGQWLQKVAVLVRIGYLHVCACGSLWVSALLCQKRVAVAAVSGKRQRLIVSVSSRGLSHGLSVTVSSCWCRGLCLWLSSVTCKSVRVRVGCYL